MQQMLQSQGLNKSWGKDTDRLCEFFFQNFINKVCFQINIIMNEIFLISWTMMQMSYLCIVLKFDLTF